jgi:hypothetical protein
MHLKNAFNKMRFKCIFKMHLKTQYNRILKIHFVNAFKNAFKKLIF